MREEPLGKAKPFDIPKRIVWEAYQRVKANRGAAGVDGQSIEAFDRDVKNNLFKLWNRLSSGSYFPPPVKRVAIKKRQGGSRPLGIPTVSDRIAQGVVKACLEPELERHFHPDSYGYRPGKSALEALGVTRQRCWRYDWVLDLDIRAFFDTIPHDLLLRAARKHTDCPWVLLYIERWLTAPVQLENGALEPREREHPRVQSSHPCWRTSFCIMRSIGGWPNTIRIFRLNALPMMPFVTAAVSVRLKGCRRILSDDLPNVDLRYIQTRHRSCIARITCDGGNT
jgi:Reverse transcriptase (RNA-dependent DNA polymerase)